MYRVGQLAKATNVSVRTLRYYDELGLLKPSATTTAGYRSYGTDAVMRLHQITALKQLGFSLAHIKQLLIERDGRSQEDHWRAALDMQLAVVRAEQQRLRLLEQSLQTTLNALLLTGEVRPDDVLLFIRALRSDYQTARRAFYERVFSADDIALLEQLPNWESADARLTEWLALLREIRTNMHQPPGSPVAERLAEQLVVLVGALFGERYDLASALWNAVRPAPGEPPRTYGLDAPLMDYIDRIVAQHTAHAQPSDRP